jgi:signal transduction histidine kinase
MSPLGAPSRFRILARILNWRRVLVTLGFSALGGLMLSPGWAGGSRPVMTRTLQLGLLAMLVFGLFEHWPRRLPGWLARWVLQVSGVGVSLLLGTFALYVLGTPDGAPPFWQVPARMEGFTNLCILGVLLGPWVALGALVRQKEALVRDQALEFALERSELERQALDARLRLVQAQVTPHFLFNTLANVQALVDTGSSQAPEVLRSLVAYLRAAVPRLDEPVTSLGEEVQLVRAYLELMHLRMPDRLQFELDVDADAMALRCPPLTLLTLVENAVRHGIDPSEEGGRIEVHVHRRGDRCRVQVSDTGVGLGHTASGLGTGLSGLRERLALIFGREATLRLAAHEPRGVRAELDFPARGAV